MTLALAPDDRPFLPRGVRMAEDRARGRKVLLAPEKAVALDAIGAAILSRVDGETTFGAIVDDLAATYSAPREQIETDVQRFMTTLRARVFLMVRQ